MEMTALIWILTYAIHSTVLIAGVWLLTSVVPKLSLSTRETLWKAALLGGIATATFQVAAGVSPPWGNFTLPTALDTEPVAQVAQVPASVDATVERQVTRHDAGDLVITTVREAKPAVAVAPAAPAPIDPSPWPWVILSLVALGSLFAVTRLVLAARRLRQQLKGRRDVIEDPVLETFLALCQKAELKQKVRLTASPKLRSPVALYRREICLPERAVDSLSARQQEGMLAHELAHLIRRDPLWLMLAATVEALMFFQPLNHVARRKIQELAEFQCDDWAARLAGSGVHLAKCLAEVAGWLEGGGATPPIAVPMADEGSPIVRRITRLLNDRRPKSEASRFAVSVAATLGLLGLVGWLAPSVGRARAAAPTSGQASAPPAASLAMMQRTGDPPGGVLVQDVHGEDGRKRSHVRIDGRDEVVHVEVERQEPEEEEDDDDGGVEIIIEGHGHWWDHLHGHVWDQFHGHIGIHIDEDEFEVEIEGLIDELDRPCFPFCGHHRHSIERHERARERAHRHAERARERAERARERAEHARERAHDRAERAHERAERARERAHEQAARARERAARLHEDIARARDELHEL